MIFEKINRHYLGPKLFSETDWEYLNRSGRPEAENVRKFLEKNLAFYPRDSINELVSRLQSGDKKNYDSVIFEIIIFSLLIALGCNVEVHPSLPNGISSRPDFLATTQSDESFYVEAVLASEYSAEEVAAKKRLEVILGLIEKLDSPYFYLALKISGDPQKPPKGRQLRNKILRWLSSLDADEISKKVNTSSFQGYPTMQWSDEGWVINFEAFPKPIDKRGSDRTIIGMMSGGVRWVNVWEPIRDSVKAKGNKYGVLDKPLLIAVNVDALHVDRIDEVQSLFGQEQLVFQANANVSAEPEMNRVANGAWYGPNGPQYTRVAGVLIFESISLWNLGSVGQTLYLNPWASLNLPKTLDQINNARVIDSKIVRMEAKTVCSILGLPDDWPR